VWRATYCSTPVAVKKLRDAAGVHGLPSDVHKVCCMKHCGLLLGCSRGTVCLIPWYLALVHDTFAFMRALLMRTRLQLLPPPRQEAMLMARLRHPQVVTLMGVCQSPPALVMELCDTSLCDLLHRARRDARHGDRLTWPRRVSMVSGVAPMQGIAELLAKQCGASTLLGCMLQSLKLTVDLHNSRCCASFAVCAAAGCCTWHGVPAPPLCAAP